MAELHAPGWVAAGVSQGLSARQALNQYREAGGSIRDSTWFKLYAQQLQYSEGTRRESSAPLDAVPTAGDITPLTTKRATGYLQTVDVFTRITGTDVIVTKPFMITTDSLLTRGEALSIALTQMQQAVDEGRYEESVIGAVYTGTREMTPGVLT